MPFLISFAERAILKNCQYRFSYISINAETRNLSNSAETVKLRDSFLFLKRQRRRFFAGFWILLFHHLVNPDDLFLPLDRFFVIRNQFKCSAIISEGCGVLAGLGKGKSPVEICVQIGRA